MSSKASAQPKTVISLGGSLIVPKGGIDSGFLTQFHGLITKLAKKRQFFIVTGGGTTTRNYQKAAKEVNVLTRDDLDWLGIHSTRLNAHLVRTIFRKLAHPVVLNHPGMKESATEPVVVAGGWRPGWSTDYVAIQLAKSYGAKEVLNLTNVDFVYDKNPHIYKDAKAIRSISWKEFRKIVGNKWDPGLNLPFDPVASALAHKLGIKVVMLNGNKLKNVEKYLQGGKFTGTVIS